MNCISEENIQAYIDNELSINEKSKINEHITQCEYCTNNVHKQRMLASMLKENIAFDEPIAIPDITQIIDGSPRWSKEQYIKSIFYVAAAASIVLALLIGLNKKQELTPELTHDYANHFEFDANKSITDQDFEITIIDSEGNITNY